MGSRGKEGDKEDFINNGGTPASYKFSTLHEIAWKSSFSSAEEASNKLQTFDMIASRRSWMGMWGTGQPAYWLFSSTSPSKAGESYSKSS